MANRSQYRRAAAAALSLAGLVSLHRLDGAAVIVNADQITSLHSPGGKKLLPGGGCAVWLADGRLVAVIEPCEEVRRLIEEAQGRAP